MIDNQAGSDGGYVPDEASGEATPEPVTARNPWSPYCTNNLIAEPTRYGARCPRCEPFACRHCGVRLYERPGHPGRYALTDRADGSDVLGSGSECPNNERGHEAR